MALHHDALATIAASVQQTCTVPGLAVAVVDVNGPDYLAGFGMADAEAGVPCTPETGFSIASVTKTYTAALAMVVQREGFLSIDDPLTRYLPWFKPRLWHRTLEPTLRDALSHRTGIAGYEALWFDTPWSRQEIIAKLGNALPLGSPRSRFAYSNLMVMAAGEAAARAVGIPYEEALQRKVLAPSHDYTSAFGWTGVSNPALPYRRTAPDGLRRLNSVDTSRANPAVGLKGSAASLATWLRLLLRGGTRELPAEAIAEMWTPHSEVRPDDEPRIYGFYGRTRRLDYGLGWFLGEHNGMKTMGHTGTLPGFRSHVVLIPEAGIGVAALANLDQTLAPEIFAYSVLDAISPGVSVDWFDHFEGVSRVRERCQDEADRPGSSAATFPLEANTICGLYDDGVLGGVEVWQSDGRLGLSWANYVSDLIPSGDGRYRLSGINCPLLGEDQTADVLTSEDGAVCGLRFLGQELKKVDTSACA